MYTVYCDGVLIFDPSDEDREKVIEEAQLSLEDNTSGTFEFTISPGSTGYDLVKKMVSEIKIFRDNTELWAGRVTTEREDFWKRRKYHAEGELSYLMDTIQPQIDYTGSPYNFLNMVLRAHNSKVSSNRQISLGTVTMSQTISFNDGYKTTWEMINDKLINAIGGHLRIRKNGNTRYLDYYDGWPTTSTQTIEFGKNLLDYAKDFDMTEFATAIMAKGASKDDGAYVTIASVNGGNEFYEDWSLINMYGRIEKVKEWGEIDDPDLLYSTVKKYMSDSLLDDLSLELSVLDLHDLNADIDAFNLLDRVHCISEPHGLDRYLPLTKLDIDLNNPANTKISLNTEKRKDLTNMLRDTTKEVAEVEDLMPDADTILEKAQKEAAKLINACTNGYITIVHNEDHASELIISERQNWRDGGKYWRWNYNGLGFFVNDEQVAVAMTMDGQIVANAITTGEMSAARIKGGTLTLGNYDNINGELVILDSKGNQIGKWDMDGIIAENGLFKGKIQNGTLSDYGVEISDGVFKGVRRNEVTAYFSAYNDITIDGVTGHGGRLAGKGGLVLRGPYLMVSKEYLAPGVGGEAWVGADGSVRAITSFTSVGEGDDRKLQFTYNTLTFVNGIATSLAAGGGQGTTDLPEIIAPSGTNTIQSDVEKECRSSMIETKEQIEAILGTKYVSTSLYAPDASGSNKWQSVYQDIDWQADAIVNCNDYRKTNAETPHYSLGWLPLNEDFPLIRSFQGVYSIAASDAGKALNQQQYTADGKLEWSEYACARPIILVCVGQHGGQWYISDAVNPSGSHFQHAEYYPTNSATPTTVALSYANYIYQRNPRGGLIYHDTTTGQMKTAASAVEGWRSPYPAALHDPRSTYPTLFSDYNMTHGTTSDFYNMGSYAYGSTDENYAVSCKRYMLAGNNVGVQFFFEGDLLRCMVGSCWKEDGLAYWGDSYSTPPSGNTFPIEATVIPDIVINYTVLPVDLSQSKIYAFKSTAEANVFIAEIKTRCKELAETQGGKKDVSE